MVYPPFESLHTPRLILRKLELRDTPLYFSRLAGSAAVTKYMLFQPHTQISESEASVQKTLQRYAAGSFYRWCITRTGEDQLIGVIDLLRFDEAQNSCSFAYMLGEEFWGQGYGTEALSAVLDFAFTRMQLERVSADHMAANAASGAVMQKVGMHCTGTILKKYEKDGMLQDAPQYRITRQEWLQHNA